MPLSPRRTEALRLLEEGTAAKLQRGDGGAARRLLEEALALARERPRLARCVRGEIAYRLAVLRLRTAIGPDDLRACIELLAAARRTPGVAPWPRVYEVAALIRLERIAPEAERAGVRAALEAAWAALAHRPDLADASARGSASQRLLLNLLESQAIAGGLDPTPLIGRCVTSPGAIGISEDPSRHTVNLSWELAQAEALEDAERVARGVFLIAPDHQVWLRPPGGGLEPAGRLRKPTILLAQILSRTARTQESLGELWSEAPGGTSQRKALSRIGEVLERLNGTARAGAIVRDGRFLALRPEEKVLGAASTASLRRVRRPRSRRGPGEGLSRG